MKFFFSGNLWRAVLSSGKVNNLFEHKIFFCAITSFCWHKTRFRATSTCFLSTQISFCATSNFIIQHKIVFHATANFYFGHSLECFVMVIYCYCNVATKIARLKKNHFYVTQKIFSFFVLHNFFIFNFYIAHWQHVDLLRSGPRNKETFHPSFNHLTNKKVFLLSRFNFQSL